jgi:DNA polymerase
MDTEIVLNRNFSCMSDAYRRFADAKNACKKCSLYHHYQQVVQSEGNASNPVFMFIGEGPGKDEVEQIRPFIGKAGQCLRNELRKHRIFSRKNTIITNILACRPLNNVFPKDASGPYTIFDQETSNVAAKQLVNHCVENWLRKEIEILRPKIIITLGSKALEFIRGEQGITEHRGSWTLIKPLQAWSLATYHPSYVIRCAYDKNKSHIVKQFEDDIAGVATNGMSFASDPFLETPSEEWLKQCVLEDMIAKGILEPEYD